METQIKDFKFDYKIADQKSEYLVVTGLVSPYDGKADQGNDIIEKGAYTRTLDQKGTKRVFLWHHLSKEPIGKAIVEDTSEGLMIKEGIISTIVAKGKDTAELIKMDALDGISIGYRAIKTAFKEGNRILKEIALEEVSIVPFPMNLNSRVNGFKSDEDINEILSDMLKKDILLTDDNFELVNTLVKKFNKLLLERKIADSSNSALSVEQERLLQLKKADDELVYNFKKRLRGI